MFILSWILNLANFIWFATLLSLQLNARKHGLELLQFKSPKFEYYLNNELILLNIFLIYYTLSPTKYLLISNILFGILIIHFVCLTGVMIFIAFNEIKVNGINEFISFLWFSSMVLVYGNFIS